MLHLHTFPVVRALQLALYACAHGWMPSPVLTLPDPCGDRSLRALTSRARLLRCRRSTHTHSCQSPTAHTTRALVYAALAPHRAGGSASIVACVHESARRDDGHMCVHVACCATSARLAACYTMRWISGRRGRPAFTASMLNRSYTPLLELASALQI